MADMTPDQYRNVLNNTETQAVDPESYRQLMTPTPLTGPKSAARYTGQAAMISGGPYDSGLRETLAAMVDQKRVRNEAANQFYNNRLLDVRNSLDVALEASPEVLQNAVMTSQERVAKIQQDMQSSIGDEAAYVQAAAPIGDGTILEEKKFRLALANDLHEMYENQGLGETVLDFLGTIVPFNQALDVAGLNDVIKAQPDLAAIATDSLDATVFAWKSLPPSRKAELYPHLRDAVIRATETLGITDGNLLKASELIQQFISIDGATALKAGAAVDTAYGALDVVPAVAGIKALNKTQKLAGAAIMREATEEVLSSSHAAKVAADAGDIDAAAKHTVGGMADGQTAADMGTTSVESYLSAMPQETGEWFRRVINDEKLPSKVQDDLNEMLAQANGYDKTITQQNDMLRIGLLSPDERSQLVTKFTERLNDMNEDYLTQNLEMGNVQMRIGKDGVEYRYTLKDKNMPTSPDGKEKLTLRTGSFKMGINDVTGNFDVTAQKSTAQTLGSKILSPATWSARTEAGDFGLEVERMLKASDLAAGYTGNVNKALDWAVEPIRGFTQGKARTRVEQVLQAGDEFINEGSAVQGRVFTPTELQDGVMVNGNKVRLQLPEEVEAYYRFRMVSDSIWKAENAVLRRELEIGGFKDVKLYGLQNQERQRLINHSVAKPYDNVGAALASVRGKAGQGVWDDALGETVNITDDYVRKVYEEGDVLVRLRRDWNTKGTGELDASGEVVQYARVPKERVRDLPDTVLNYKQGYVPKINQANYVVSQIMPKVARNRPNLFGTQAVRAFDSLADAKAFREEQITKYANKNDVSREKAELMFPEVGNVSDMPLAQRLEEAVGSHNGLYHGERAKDELVFGLSGQRLERVSPFEAYQRYSHHLGRFASHNEVRIAAEKRWLNTVRNQFPEIQVRGFNDTAIPSGTPKAKALENMRTQIREWNAIPTQEESMYEALLQRMHDWTLAGRRNVFGLNDKESIKSINYLKHANPASAIKSAVMHHLLGFGNITQLYLQASAATVALSRNMNPSHIAAMFSMGILDNVQNSKALEGVYKMLRGAGIIDEATEITHKTWARTGLRESVENNPDIARITGNGLGITGRILRTPQNLSLLFYRMGELAARRVTFSSELAAWQRRTGKKIPTDAELEDILTRVHQDLLTLGPANRAWWQGGPNTGTVRQVSGVATQFMQVGMKTLELAVKGKGAGGFTNSEKARILAGQVFLFGTAGVPLGSTMGQLILNGLGIEEADQVTADAINQGFIGTAVNLLFDTNLEVSDRIALGTQTTDMIEDFLTSEDPFWIRATGPAGSGVFGRWYDQLDELAVLGGAVAEGHVEWDAETLKMGLSILGQIPSTTRNLIKAQIMRNAHVIVDKNKKVLLRKDFSLAEEIATMWGLRLNTEEDIRQGQLTQQAIEESIKEYADTRVNLAYKAIYEMKLSPEKVKSIIAATYMIDTALDPYIVMQGRKAYTDRIYGDSPKTKEEELVQKFLKTTAPDKISKDMLMERQSIGTGKAVVRPFSEVLDGPQAGE